MIPRCRFAAEWPLVLVVASVGTWSTHSTLIRISVHETGYQGSVDPSLVRKRADGGQSNTGPVDFKKLV